MIDSHCHLLSDSFDEDREVLISSLFENGLTAAIEAGVDVQNGYAARTLCEAHSGIWYLAGIHPHDAKAADYLDHLKTLYAHSKCVGIGEIGLDYHYDLSPREVQLRVFHEQMALAKELKAPVCIHTREAIAPTLEVLSAYRGDVVGVLHCFSGSVETAKQCLDLGYYISFAGPVTFKNANKLLDVAKYVPSDRILVETDSPYLAPVPKRGKRNQPDYAYFTLSRVAELRGQDVEELDRLTEENTRRIYPKMVK